MEAGVYNIPDGAEVMNRIRQVKKKLGSKLLILGHHYQHDSVIQFADRRGDSFLLAREAARCREAEYIVFLGVNFMAETADIVTSAHQKVILPDPGAGCPMAGMAEMDQVAHCWNQLQEQFPGEVIPVTYVNSSAELKAFCGKNGGLTCTSSSAEKAFKWVREQGKRILFFPDEHLGRNTGLKMGISTGQMAVWDRFRAVMCGSKEPGIILWNGYCPVHQKITPELVNNFRSKYPGAKVVVHPECSRETVQAAGLAGSTEYIIKTVHDSPPGTVWAVGTEINLVNRVRGENTSKRVLALDWENGVCHDMMKINTKNLLWCLENLLEGRVVNQVRVNRATAEWANTALQRMLSVG